MALTSGTRLGPYEILEPIGKGGMGEVYRAKDSKLGRDVAIKVLPGEFAQDAERLRRFQREAKVLASLNNPNIAAIYGLEHSDETHYLVLELVPGETLAERIARGPIPVDEALEIAKKIAEALEEAHEQGIVHRDLKPANIKQTEDGKIKVLDFGLAKALVDDAAEADSSMSPTLTRDATRVGVILGTAAYMSPEQAKGKRVDKRADVWAFGAVLFEMLTAKRAFIGEDVSDTLAAVLRAEPEWNALPVETHGVLRNVLRLCLTKDAKRRVRDIGDVRLAMEGAFDRETAESVAMSTGASAVTSNLVKWVLATFVLTAAAAAVTAWQLRPTEYKPVLRFTHDLLPNERLGGSSSVAVAPDGSRFAFATNSRLFVRGLDESAARPLTNEDEVARFPVFSPDGEWVAYLSRANEELRKVSILGGTSIAIAATGVPQNNLEGIQGMEWTENDTIVYAVEDGLMRVPSGGGTPERLSDRSGYDPRLLPDGDTVLLVTRDPRSPGDAPTIALLSLSSGEVTELFDGDSADYIPTGHIVFVRDGTMFAVPFDLETHSATGGPVPVIEVGQGRRRGSLDISSSGTLVYAYPRDVSSDRVLGLVDLNVTGVVERLDLPLARYSSPRLSPDGRRLVVQAPDENDNQTLWIYELGGGRALRQLTFDGNNTRPVWTPDGERITFTSDRDGTTSIYWKPADGSGSAERLTTAEDKVHHLPSSWSPDGRRLAYMVRMLATRDEWDTWTLSLDGGPEPLYDEMGRTHMGPEFSPDGKWLAYHSGPNPGDQDVYVEPFPPTGARHRISTGGGYWSMWSRDGAALLYRRLAGTAERQLLWVDVTTGPDFGFTYERTLPLDDFVIEGFQRDYDITFDGDKLLLVFPAADPDRAGSRPDRIHLVLNWFEELKRLVPSEN